jgi:hypothetical protein
MTAQAAFTQAGYPAPQNAPRLRNNELVAKRIEELQARNERKAEMAALSRDELIGIPAEIVHAARARLSEARLGDGLKAAEMLAKLTGWNEPDQIKHNHVHVQVDSALIEQLRSRVCAARGAERESVLALAWWVRCSGRRRWSSSSDHLNQAALGRHSAALLGRNVIPSTKVFS